MLKGPPGKEFELVFEVDEVNNKQQNLMVQILEDVNSQETNKELEKFVKMEYLSPKTVKWVLRLPNNFQNIFNHACLLLY